MRKLLLFLALFITVQFASASHWVAGNIQYECLGGNQYKIQVITYWDCGGITPPSTIPIEFNSSCGTLTETGNPIVLDPSTGATSINTDDFLCESLQNCDECDNPPDPSCPQLYPGIEKRVYEVTVTLADCQDWVISYTSCCRNNPNIPNPSTSNSYAQDDWYIFANLNNLDYPCNSSPSFFADVRAFICEGYTNVLDFSSSDPDGDSLAYSLVFPLADAANSIFIEPGYTVDSFIATDTAGIEFNSATGIMVLTPDDSIPGQEQVAFFSVRVDEYRNGVLIGSLVRDVQLNSVENCQPMDPVENGFTNVSNPGSYINDSTLYVCAGDTLSFDILVLDSVYADTLHITSNLAALVPNSTFNENIVSAGLPASITLGNFTIAPTNDDVGEYYFNIIVENNGCPVKIQEIFEYNLIIFGETIADLNNDTTCIGGINIDSAFVFAEGGTEFKWSVIDSTQDSTAFAACDTCFETKVLPPRTMDYVVTTDLDVYGCKNKDTVTVVRVKGPDPIPTMDTCLGDSLILEVLWRNPFGRKGTQYYWSWANEDSRDTVASWQVFADDSIYYTFEVIDTVDYFDIEGPNDTVVCHWIDSVLLRLTDCYVPVIPTPEDTTLKIPNIFTPNNDGNNDFFEIANVERKVWDLTIYNRWGKTVLEEFFDYQNDWDGGNLQDGTYYYTLVNRGKGGRVIEKKGWFVIAR